MSTNDFDSADPALYDIATHAVGPAGALPLTDEMLRERPSGDLFGWTQNAGMGWEPSALGGREFLILSTHGGIRRPDGTPVALGYHTGHWEVGLLTEAAALELKSAGAIPFAAACTDPCDGRSQGTPAMFDSLAYRNDAAVVFRRLIRSLPTRRGVLGVATCDKGLPAMMMALAGSRDLPAVLVPGGVTLLPRDGEDAGRVQAIGVRFVHGEITRQQAAEMGCRACASPGGGCQFLGTAATSQVVAEALGIALGHSALAPSGHAIWLDMARRSARALMALEQRGIRTRDVLTDAALKNAMVTHAAFGGSTNLILHLAAIAHAAGLRRPTAQDWIDVNRRVPRIVDALPNGPRHHATIQVFLAGGVPEVMLHLRRAGLLETRALTASGATLGEQLDEWESSTRRGRLRARLRECDGVDPDDVILAPEEAVKRGLTPTFCVAFGNLAPEGSVIKSTAIDPSVVGADGVYRFRGPAKVFLSEPAAIAAIKTGGISAGDVLVLACRGPLGSGMEETYQLTAALKYLPFGKHVALVTDARFSGVSTGACIGHVSPEALAGGPIGKIRDGDVIRIVIDRVNLTGSVDLVGEDGVCQDAATGDRLLQARPPRPDLTPDPAMPDDTRLWAALQDVSGGPWGGSVFDLDAILKVLAAGRKALLVLAAAIAIMACAGGSPTSPQSPSGPPATSPPATGDTLKAAAAERQKLVGTAVQAGLLGNAQYANVAGREFSYLTAEYEMKWNVVEPSQGAADFSRGDTIVDYAASHGMQVKGHTLIWHGATPSWVAALSAPDLRAAVDAHIRAVVGHYRGRVHAWDVVNEAVADSGTPLRDTVFRQKLGDTYIDEAFRLARAADPGALLFYNDYGGEGSSQKANRIYELVQELLSKGVPIDGVGLQMHISANSRPSDADIAANMRRLASLGLIVHVSEMDVRINNAAGTDQARLALQRSAYHDVVRVCVMEPRCEAITFWGFSDAHTWITGDRPLLFDAQYEAKPAYFGVLDALRGR